MNKTRHTEVDLDSFMEMLASNDGMTRQKARESLVALGEPAVASLINALQTSTSDEVRWEAAKAFGELVDARSIPALVKALEDSESDVAWLAAEALCQFKKRAWSPLLQALIKSEGNSGSLRQGAHQVLVHQKEEGFNDALASLIEALQPRAAPVLTVFAAKEVLARMKANT